MKSTPKPMRLEHVISEEFEDRIAARLGNPVVDPHGDPIPAKDGTIVAVKEQSLLNLAPGRIGVRSRASAIATPRCCATPPIWDCVRRCASP